jgi:hypothetical protein
MRLSDTGELIAETGFDGGSYRPRYGYRTSVFLGDMSKEDIQIKKEVQARERSIAAENARAIAMKAASAAEAYRRQEAHNQMLRGIEASGAYQMEVAANKGYLAAKAHGHLADVNPWIGSPFAGFGDAVTEQRINPDSNLDVRIVETDMPTVEEYGINNWQTNTGSTANRVTDSEFAYTEGKVWKQTLVDYARTPELSLVGLATPSVGILAQRAQVARVYADTFSGYGDTNVPSTDSLPADILPAAVPNNTLKYGLLALAAYFLFK